MATKSGGPKTNERKKNTPSYAEYVGTRNWRLLDRAIDALVENGDITEKTNRAYIVGYMCRILSEPEEI